MNKTEPITITLTPELPGLIREHVASGDYEKELRSSMRLCGGWIPKAVQDCSLTQGRAGFEQIF